MQLAAALMMEHSRTQTDRIAAWVGRDRRRFDELFDIFLHGGRGLAARAAWVVGVCVEAHPALIRPHLEALLDNLRQPHLHPAIPRHTFRLLQFAPISGEWETPVLTAALAALGGPLPVAVKANAMTVLKRLTANHPDLQAEIRLLIEAQLPAASPAFRARARRDFGLKP